MTDQTKPLPDELEDRLDNLMEGGAEQPAAGGESVSTNPDETEAEHEPMAVADADHTQEPSGG